MSGSSTGRARSASASAPPSRSRRRRNAARAAGVMVFDQSGNVIKHWGGPGQGYNWPKSEHGVYIDDNDFVWLAGNDKTDGQLLKFTMDGKFVMQIGKPITGPDSNATDRLGSPADIAVDVAAKEVYVADGYTNRRVIVFDSETGAYKRHWGAYGKQPERREDAALRSRRSRPRSSSAIRCTAFASPRTAWSMCATAPTIACRSSARTARSWPSISSRSRPASTARSTRSRSRRTRSRSSSTWWMARTARSASWSARACKSWALRPHRPPGRPVHRRPQHHGRSARQHLHRRGADRAAHPEVPPPRHTELTRGIIAQDAPPGRGYGDTAWLRSRNSTTTAGRT